MFLLFITVGMGFSDATGGGGVAQQPVTLQTLGAGQ
jgi:hypothetical protein